MEEEKDFEERLRDAIRDCKERNILRDFIETHGEDNIIQMIYNEMFHDFITDCWAKGLSDDEIEAEITRIANS